MNTSRFNPLLKENLHSFQFILLIAFAVRLIATIFSQGYGMHDDHFLIIEAGASWVDGYDYNLWLPWTEGNRGAPEGHSFTYVGLNFLYFWILKFFGIVNPKVLMFFNRFVHALASLIVVWYGMKITEKLSTRQTAIKVGWILALLWILPFVSVRNLVEVASLPFLVAGMWAIIRSTSNRNLLLGGLLIGMAVSFRYQIGVFAIGVAAYYFFRAQYKQFFAFSAGVIIVFCSTQGIVDFFIWGYPFAEFIGYVTYNMNQGTDYLPNSNYFMYFIVLTGCLFIPLGLLVGYGFFKSFKRYTLLFIPTFAFLLFHTFYPNRQERFILTILPFFIILGVMGYQELCHFKVKEKLWKISMTIFWIFNTLFLCFASTMYSKKSRVEAMYSIYANNMDNERILQEGSASQRTSMLPKFYGKAWHCTFVERIDSTQDLRVVEGTDYDYIVFFDELKLNERINQYKEIYPNMKLVKQCEPSSIDVLLRKLNPKNANEYIEVWKTNVPR